MQHQTNREFFNNAPRTIIFTGDDFAYMKTMQLEHFRRTGVRLNNSDTVAALIDLHRQASAKFKAYETKQQEAAKGVL